MGFTLFRLHHFEDMNKDYFGSSQIMVQVQLCGDCPYISLFYSL
jgi:hypothetical protein